jgi:hypothetical protein
MTLVVSRGSRNSAVAEFAKSLARLTFHCALRTGNGKIRRMLWIFQRECSTIDPMTLSRVFYAFALRDEIPLPDEGWSVFLHPLECHAPNSNLMICEGEYCPKAFSCSFYVRPTVDTRFEQAYDHLTEVLASVTNNPSEAIENYEGIPRIQVVALVGGPIDTENDDEGHLQKCMTLLHDQINSFRIASQAMIPNFSIERVWPVYFRLIENDKKFLDVINIIVVEHGFLERSQMSERFLEDAIFLFKSSQEVRHSEVYLDFKLGARNASLMDGDYVTAVLKTATAAELHIKQLAWMLTWEATVKSVKDRHPGAKSTGVTSLKPQELIGAVLSQRLKGNWDARFEKHAIGGWRKYIARPRTDVLHFGKRPSSDDANLAISALEKLESHLWDALASQSQIYPITSITFLGRKGLELRNAFTKVSKQVRPEELPNLRIEYLAWLENQFNINPASVE